MQRKAVLPALLLVMAWLPGCGTIITNIGGNGTPYSGAEFDVRGLEAGGTIRIDDPSLLFFVLFAVDLPLSLAADTLMLPVTLTRMARSSDEEPQARPSRPPPVLPSR